MDYDTLCRIVLTAIQKSVRISEQEEREILEHARKYLEKQNIQTDRIQELSALKSACMSWTD
ncbi:hypothetical protein LC724_10910 [Blautia sp. RD014234]|nr:hypothetical protein [Blautia parvula]